MSETVELNGTECVVMTKAEHESHQEEKQQLKQTVSELQEQPTVEMEDKVGSLKIGGLPVGKIIDSLIQDRDDMEDRLDYQKETIMDILGNSQEESETETHQEYPGETPLEEVVSYPEQVAQEELSANAERARFIAMDVLDYAQKAPAGFVLDSSTIRKVIKAKEGDRPHTQTVDRIMKFLDRFGKEETEKKKHRGRNKIVFSHDLVKQMNHTRCDGDQATDPERAVTTG